MTAFDTPFAIWRTMLQAGLVMAEANAVFAMRVWGMAGMWSMPPSERGRMVREKTDAFTRAAWAAGTAAALGGRPDEIASAALAPVRAKTRANARRLARRGPARPRGRT